MNNKNSIVIIKKIVLIINQHKFQSILLLSREISSEIPMEWISKPIKEIPNWTAEIPIHAKNIFYLEKWKFTSR